jgi:GNAT superfamily N-acetyltransferase
MRDWNGMLTDGASSVQSPDDVAPHSTPPSDLDILHDTILKSVTSSPGAFLATAEELEAETPEYWENRLKSSTWAVVQRGNQTLGIAAAKPPGEVDDYARQENACFIESVWIDPSMRGKGLGERLVTYLIEQQRKAVGIQRFYLWVFDYNAPAIRLYDRMDFKPTEQPSQLLDKAEIQFLRAFDSDLIDEDELKRNAVARKKDRKDFRITYRLLSATPSRTHLPPFERLRGWQTAGSMSRNFKAAMRESRLGRSVR